MCATVGGGGTNMIHTGMSHKNVPDFFFFMQEILKHGSPFFMKKSVMSLNFRVFCETPENSENLMCFCDKIARTGYLFSEKSLNMGTYLWKFPLNMGMSLELPAAHPRPIRIWIPPPYLSHRLLLSLASEQFSDYKVLTRFFLLFKQIWWLLDFFF